MAKRFNEPNHSFIIETLGAKGEHICYWRIDQVLVFPDNDVAIDRLCNQVNRQLSALTERLGTRFGVVIEGPKEMVDVAVEKFGYTVG